MKNSFFLFYGQEKNPNAFKCYCSPAQEHLNPELAVNQCTAFSFKSASVQLTAYEMYTLDLRKKLHTKAAKYLESIAPKCKACGGTGFVPVKVVQYTSKELKLPKRKEKDENRVSPKQMAVTKLRKRELAHLVSVASPTETNPPAEVAPSHGTFLHYRSFIRR